MLLCLVFSSPAFQGEIIYVSAFPAPTEPHGCHWLSASSTGWVRLKDPV